jgi:hypothetical protein
MTPLADDKEAIVAVALDYFEGWFGGDVARMDEALHPELAKRSLEIRDSGSERLETLTKQVMLDATREGVGKTRGDGDRGPGDPCRGYPWCDRERYRSLDRLPRVPSPCTYGRGVEDRERALGVGVSGPRGRRRYPTRAEGAQLSRAEGADPVKRQGWGFRSLRAGVREGVTRAS